MCMSYQVIKDLLCLLCPVLRIMLHYTSLEIVCKMAESVLNHLLCFFIDHKSYREDMKNN